MTERSRQAGVQHGVAKEHGVPIVHVHLVAGRSASVKEKLARELTDAVATTLGSDPGKVHVLISEFQPGEWTVAGLPVGFSEGGTVESA